MSTTSPTIDPLTARAVRLFVHKIADQYDLVGAILFGSRARQTHQQDSDADVAVLLRGEHQRFLPTKLEMADVAFDVLLDTGIRIQPFPIWEDEWAHPETYVNPELLDNIAQEGIRLVADYRDERLLLEDAREIVEQAERFVAVIRAQFLPVTEQALKK